MNEDQDNRTGEAQAAPETAKPAGDRRATGAAGESSFPAGQRATFDLRDSTGTVAVRDGESGTVRISGAAGAPPFVLREGDHFRVRTAGGTVAVPPGLPIEVSVPPAVQVRVERPSGSETVVRPIATGSSAASGEEAPAEPDALDLDAFAREMSETAQRIFQRMTGAVRATNVGFADEVARKLDEAAVRIDEHARRVAERVQQEVERANQSGGRWQEAARRAAERAEASAAQVAARVERHAQGHGAHGAAHAEREARHAERHAERAARHAERASERQTRSAAGRAGRGRWWFADRMNDWDGGGSRVTGSPSGSTTGAGDAPASVEERRAILAMLAEGKITSEQAAKLLDALG